MPTAARLERWLAAGAGDGGLDEVRAALDDDLDTPAAIAAIDAAAAEGAGCRVAAGLLGVDLRDPGRADPPDPPRWSRARPVKSATPNSLRAVPRGGA
jgi:hypothetical protein